MKIYLPRSLAVLAKLCARNNTRYAIEGVRVMDTGGGTYRLEVTDGKVLAVVRGNSLTDAFPAVEEFEPPCTGEIIVPRESWVEGFRLKAPKYGANSIGIAAREEVILDAEGEPITGKTKHLLMGTPTGSLKSDGLEGRFPDVDNVIKPSGALTRFSIDPGNLIRVLEVFKALGIQNVGMLFYGTDKPVGFVGHTDDGMWVDAILMPLAGEEKWHRHESEEDSVPEDEGKPDMEVREGDDSSVPHRDNGAVN